MARDPIVEEPAAASTLRSNQDRSGRWHRGSCYRGCPTSSNFAALDTERSGICDELVRHFINGSEITNSAKLPGAVSRRSFLSRPPTGNGSQERTDLGVEPS